MQLNGIVVIRLITSYPYNPFLLNWNKQEIITKRVFKKIFNKE